MNAYLIMLILCILPPETSIREKEHIFLMPVTRVFFHTFETPSPAAPPHPQSRRLKGSIYLMLLSVMLLPPASPRAVEGSGPPSSGPLLAARCWEHPDMALGGCCPLSRSSIEPSALPALSAPPRDPPYHAFPRGKFRHSRRGKLLLALGLVPHMFFFFLSNFMNISKDHPPSALASFLKSDNFMLERFWNDLPTC